MERSEEPELSTLILPGILFFFYLLGTFLPEGEPLLADYLPSHEVLVCIHYCIFLYYTGWFVTWLWEIRGRCAYHPRRVSTIRACSVIMAHFSSLPGRESRRAALSIAEDAIYDEYERNDQAELMKQYVDGLLDEEIVTSVAWWDSVLEDMSNETLCYIYTLLQRLVGYEPDTRCLEKEYQHDGHWLMDKILRGEV